MDKLSKQLYVIHDKYTRMYKVGSSTQPLTRLQAIESECKYKMSMVFTTPGHDYFMEHVPIPRADHPVWHHGRGEWYHDTPELRGFLVHLYRMSHCINIQGFIIDSWMHKYTVA